MKIPMHKYGVNEDVGGDEDIWSVGGDYPYPDSTAATTVVSDNVNDALGGAGAQAVTLYGHDAAGHEIKQTVILNGTTPVALPMDISICYRGKALRPGSNGTNVGNIQIKHDTTVIAQIDAGKGQTMMAIYRVPLDFYGVLNGWYCTIGKNKSATVTIEMWMRTPGGAWQVKEIISLGTTSGSSWIYEFPNPFNIPPGVDVRIRAVNPSTTGLFISAGFDLELVNVA